MRTSVVFVAIMLLLAVTMTGARRPRCHLDPHPGRPCGLPSQTVQRFYYNHRRGRCVPFTYYGCGGNANRFPTRQRCRRVCQI